MDRLARRRDAALVTALALAAALLAVLASAGSAQAAGSTTNAQLALTGVTTGSSVVGGSVVDVHPGDSVRFAASSAPTAGLGQLGINLGSVLQTLAGYQVKADLSGLPGGRSGTVLSGATAVTIRFPNVGTYNFTWTAESVTLLGLVPIKLDLNQLQKAGVAVDASETWHGQVVVANAPGNSGVGVQLPGVSVAPSVGPVQAPPVTVPGVGVQLGNTPAVSIGGGPSSGASPGANSPSGPAPSTQPATAGAATPGSGRGQPVANGPNGARQAAGTSSGKARTSATGPEHSGTYPGEHRPSGRASTTPGRGAAVGGPATSASPGDTGELARARPVALASRADRAGGVAGGDHTPSTPFGSTATAVLAVLATVALSFATSGFVRQRLVRRH
jgi:hypothetical protein